MTINLLRTQWLYNNELDILADKFIDQYYNNPEYYGDYEDRENQPDFFYDGLEEIFTYEHQFIKEETNRFYVLAFSPNRDAIQDLGLDQFSGQSDTFLSQIEFAAFVAMRDDLLDKIHEKIG